MDYALWRLACTDQCISYLNHISFHTRKLIITSAQSTPEYSIAQSNFFASIVFQTGCFCNPGACAKYLGLSHSDLVSNFEVLHNTTISIPLYLQMFHVLIKRMHCIHIRLGMFAGMIMT